MRFVCLLGALALFSGTTAYSQPKFLNRFYAGGWGTLRTDFSQATGDLQVFRKTVSGLGWDGSARIGFNFTDKLFLESGFGRYQTAHAFSLEATVSYGTSYRNYTLRQSWLHIPIRAGYTMYERGGFSIASLLGCNIIADGKFAGRIPQQVFDEEPLVIKDGWGATPPRPANGFLVIRESNDFAALLYSGFRTRVGIGGGWSLSADAGFSLGLRQITGGTFVFRPVDAAPEEDFQGRYSTFKGDALGLALGVYYSFGK